MSDMDIYEPIERAQKYQEQQNALARQKAVRNALAANIDPATGRTNWQNAYAMGGQDVAPDLQAMQQEDFGRLTKEDTDYLANMRGQLEMYVNDQPSYNAWVAKVKERHPYANFPTEFSPQVKNELSGFSKKLEMAGRTGSYNTLTPEEEQALGLPPGVVAQRGPQGQLKIPYKPTTPRAATGAGGVRAPSGYRYTQDGTLEAIPGGPADKSKGTPAATDKNLPGKQQLNTIVDKMRASYELLRSEGAAIQPGGDVLSNVGARIRGTGAAQTVEGAIGTKAQSERTKIKNMRPLLVNAIKQATGMSAQQMNSNVELKLFLDTATNPDTADIDANLAALENLNALYGLGLDTGAPATPTRRTIVKTGTLNGRKVVQYSDGSTEYAD